MMTLQITNDIHKGRLAAVSFTYVSMSESEFELAVCNAW